MRVMQMSTMIVLICDPRLGAALARAGLPA